MLIENVLESESELPEDFLYFPNLESIKSYFRNDPLPVAQEILERFEKHCIYMDDPGEPAGRRRPFIVIEGNHRASPLKSGEELWRCCNSICKSTLYTLDDGKLFSRYEGDHYHEPRGRDVMGMKLAARLRGRYLNHPASCLHDYFLKLPKGSDLRRAFYLLYWWEQVIFSLLQAMPENSSLPSMSSPIFQAPEDLMQPDLIAYIHLPDNPNTERYKIAAMQRNRTMKVYQRLQAIYPITFQEVKHTYRLCNEELYITIRRNLSDSRDFRVKNFFDYS